MMADTNDSRLTHGSNEDGSDEAPALVNRREVDDDSTAGGLEDNESIVGRGDSDEEGEEAAFHFETVRENVLLKNFKTADDGRIHRNQYEVVDEFEELIAGNRVCFDCETTDLKIPRVPEDWRPKPIAAATGELPFDQVNNPGNWEQHCFEAKFNESGKKYTAHEMPAGAQVCPKNEDTVKQTAGDYEFIYDGSFDQLHYFGAPFRSRRRHAGRKG